MSRTSSRMLSIHYIAAERGLSGERAARHSSCPTVHGPIETRLARPPSHPQGVGGGDGTPGGGPGVVGPGRGRGLGDGGGCGVGKVVMMTGSRCQARAAVRRIPSRSPPPAAAAA